MPSIVLDAWRFSPKAPATATVLPDGCRDLILRVAPDGQERWLVSDLAGATADVACEAGEHFAGLRFQPGALFDAQRLRDVLASRAQRDETVVLAIVEDLVRADARVTEALAALAACGSVQAACRQLGTGERSLERLLHGATGRPPGFWKGLARARRAARALAGSAGLLDVALAHGYADQAHMSRDFQRWFGCTPRQFRASPDVMALVQSAGYA